MKNTLRLLAGASLLTFASMPAVAQTEIDVGSLTCAEFASLDGEALVTVIEAMGAMALPDDMMAEDGVPNNELDPGAGSDASSEDDEPVEENAMSEADVADDAIAADPATDDLGETITLACEGMADMTVVEALAAFK